MKTLMSAAESVGHIPMRRTLTYAAALALNNNDPQTCLDLLSSSRQQNYVTIRNLKALAFVKAGRFEDVLAILRATLQYDIPVEGGRKRSFAKNTVRNYQKIHERLNFLSFSFFFRWILLL